ncbi:MAG TPA: PilZ domain-containing protein [Steroidobacteraceae bacterium]|nr:PilZ domain-containing protein [Steroidobacteraceae bacterium]
MAAPPPRRPANLADGSKATATAVGLAYHDEMPLGFRPITAIPDDVELLRLSNENQQILQLDASLEERHPIDPKDDDVVVRHELERLESKLNVVMHMLARLLARDNVLPSDRKFRLAADGIEWDNDAALKVDSLGMVALHINRTLPHPLQLPGKVVGCHASGDKHRVAFAFEGVAPHVIELLEKMIFRHHRRAVADARSVKK